MTGSTFSWKEQGAPFILLLFAAFAVFGLSMNHDFLLNWDDPAYVTKNESIKAITWPNIKTAFSTFYVGNYAPLHIISYMFDFSVWGGRPAGFIFSNILCHWANSVLVYLLLCRFSLGRIAALAAALLFLVHPVQVESVVWISQRKNVLSMFFYLVSLTMYIRYKELPDKGGRATYVISLVAFLAALLTKSVVVILPLILLLYDFCLSKERLTSRVLLDKIPYLLVAIGSGYLAMLSQSAEYGGGGRTGYPGGDPFTTFLTMLPVFTGYVQMVFWPAKLSAVYAPEIKTFMDWEVVRAGFLLSALPAGAILAFRQNRHLFFWIMAIPTALLPVAQIVPLVTLMNDRYLYFPMLGVAACFGFLVNKIQSSATRSWRTPAIALLLILLAVYAIAAVNRSHVWQNSTALWQDATVKQPASAVAWLMLGEIYEKGGRYADAIASQERASRVCRGVECRLALRKLSELYLRADSLDKAGQTIETLLRLFPQAAESHALLGHLHYQNNDLKSAETSYLNARKLDPRMITALNALGNVYLATARPALAMQEFRQVLTYTALTAELAYSMACAEALQGNRQSALNYLDQALRLGYTRPDSIWQTPELDLLKNDREFLSLMQRYFGK